MQRLRSFILFLATIGAITLALSALPRGPASPHLEPRQVTYIARWRESLAEEHPQIVLLGNSMLGHGINTIHFALRTGLPTVKMWDGGVASAWRYLMLKNLIAPSPDKPEMVIIFFKDHYLTEPTFRVTGEYKHRLDALRHRDEPLLDQLAFGQQRRDPLAYLISDLWSLDRQREVVKPTVEKWVKKQVGSGMHVGGMPEVDEAIARVFADSKMNTALFSKAQVAAMDTKRSDSREFQVLLKESFLPAELALARKAGIRLAYVRIKRVQVAQAQEDGRGPPYDNPYMTGYMKDLSDYLTSQDITLVDLTRDTRLKVRHYADGDHLNEEGRFLMTAIVAEALQGRLPTPHTATRPFAKLLDVTKPIPLQGPFKASPPFAWIASAPEWLAYSNGPGDVYRSVLEVLEDGVPLGPRIGYTAPVAAEGGGRYSHWRDAIYFSTPDNSDPNTNGRTYSIRFTLPQ